MLAQYFTVLSRSSPESSKSSKLVAKMAFAIGSGGSVLKTNK
jgi:hypothetical protein